MLNSCDMLCPIDQTELVMSDRQGVEIDYCPKCRGVWLDRGELDKIIDRAASPTGEPEHGLHDDDDDRRYREQYRPKKKKRSMLEEFFDFG